MNPWTRQTRQLVTTSNYLDQLQLIYTHEDGERNVDATLLASIVNSYTERNEQELMNHLLQLEKFPYKDSYVGFLRKDRTAIERNPETVRRICDRLFPSGQLLPKINLGVVCPNI